MTWDIVNSIGRVLLTIIVVIKVTRFGLTLNKVERVGLGLMGSGSLLTVNVIWDMRESPFWGWSVSLITYGAVLFIAGRTWRDWRHEHRGMKATEQARQHLRQRGKL